MSFDLFKKQVKYCYLKKEDKELDKLKQKRQYKDNTDIKVIDNLYQENIDFLKENINNSIKDIPEKLKIRIVKSFKKEEF